MMIKLLVPLLGLLSLPLHAAELRVPEPFNVLAINGKDGPSSLQRTKTLPLQTGRNVIVLEYDQMFDAAYGDSHDRIRSKPFALLLDAQASDQLTLLDPAIRTGEAAHAWVVNPVVSVQNASKQPIKAELVSVEKLAGEWLLPGASVAALSSPAAATKTVQPIPTGSAATTPAAAVNAPDTLQMLYYFWQQATPEQRAQFLQTVAAGK